MLETIVGLHSLWRWVVLLAIVVGIVRGFSGWLRGATWSPRDRQIGLLVTTSIDIQFLLGAVLWLGQQRWSDTFFFAVIHPVVMIVALVVAHATTMYAKKASPDVAKFRALALGLLVATILITGAIPPGTWGKFWA